MINKGFLKKAAVVTVIYAAGVLTGMAVKSGESKPIQNANVSVPAPVLNQNQHQDHQHNQALPQGIERVTVDEAKKLFDSGKALFIDARNVSAYVGGHVKGAVNIPLSSVPAKFEEYKATLQGKTLVTYCSGNQCKLSEKVAVKLKEAGYKNIKIYYDGWPKWSSSGYPISGDSIKK